MWHGFTQYTQVSRCGREVVSSTWPDVIVGLNAVRFEFPPSLPPSLSVVNDGKMTGCYLWQVLALA